MEVDEPHLCIGFTHNSEYIVFRETSTGRICPAPGIVTQTVVDFLSSGYQGNNKRDVTINGKDFHIVFRKPHENENGVFFSSVHLVRDPDIAEKKREWELILFQKKMFQKIGRGRSPERRRHSSPKARSPDQSQIPPPLPPPSEAPTESRAASPFSTRRRATSPYAFH
jgi:hypothetical protein